MKRFKFAWIAACAFTVLAAVTFIGCGKEDAPEKAVTGLGGAASGPATVFDITTSRLEKGGISFSYTEGAAACQMLDRMIDSFEVLLPDDPESKKIMTAVRDFAGELGLKSFLGSGASVKKNGDYYRCIDFEYAKEHKGLIWDIIGTNVSSGPAPELKLASPKSAFAATTKFEPGALYAYIDKKLRATLDEEIMAVIDQQISSLASQGIQPDKLLECISGITLYVEGREFTEEDFKALTESEDAQAKILEMIPKFALVLTTKNDICWKALENFISQASPELVQDGRIVPIEGIAIFQAGNYLVATNEEAAIRDRIAGKGSDLSSNAEFAKMLALAGNDFTSYSFISEDYFKMLNSISGIAGSLAGDITGGADPSAIFAKGFHSTLATCKIDADGLTFTTITPDLQIALLNSGTVAGVISGLLPYAGQFAQILKAKMDMDGGDFGDSDRMGRQIAMGVAFAQLKDAKIPEGKCVFFTFSEESGELVFAKWDDAEGGVVTVGETDEEEFPYVVLTSPEAAAKADNPEETVVFYEDPTEFFDGIFVVFGDDSAKFLEGDFENHTEAMEAVVNTFGLSEKAAADLLKKAAAIDELFED